MYYVHVIYLQLKALFKLLHECSLIIYVIAIPMLDNILFMLLVFASWVFLWSSWHKVQYKLEDLCVILGFITKYIILKYSFSHFISKNQKEITYSPFKMDEGVRDLARNVD